MFRWTRKNCVKPTRFPRIRGDVPYRQVDPPHFRQFSPHTRGCSYGGGLALLPQPVFPACAGMFPGFRRASQLGQRFPRMRRDVPAGGYTRSNGTQFSPHARGCSAHPRFPVNHQCVFPACAGMFRMLHAHRWYEYHFPRVCGDVPTVKVESDAITEFSPQTRRSSITKNLEFFHWGILPAQTGTFR